MWGVGRSPASQLCRMTSFRQVVVKRSLSEKVSLNLHHTIAGRRRFYKHVGVERVEDTDMVGKSLSSFYCCILLLTVCYSQFKVTLDGRTLKTPGMNPLHVSSHVSACSGVCPKKPNSSVFLSWLLLLLASVRTTRPWHW